MFTAVCLSLVFVLALGPAILVWSVTGLGKRH